MSKTQTEGKEGKFDLYQTVTDKIVAELQNGNVPWTKPWNVAPAMNYVSKKRYRGINILLLGMTPYASPYWMTYKQAQDKGGQVRKGEKSTLVVFWTMLEKLDPEAKDGKKRFGYLKYYKLFNAEQVDGIDFPEVTEFVADESADAILDHYAEECPIEYGGDDAGYVIPLDRIRLPLREHFETPEAFYSTAFHEATHSTGAKHRLNRKGIAEFDKFGSEQYAEEELIGEMGACFLSAELGIERIEPSAAYLRYWISKLQDDRKLIVTAANKAAKAAEYVMGRVEVKEAVAA